jgi:RNA polymerase sigma-70 factor (ECF subfamily)
MYPPREADEEARRRAPDGDAGDVGVAERAPFRQIFEQHVVLVSRTLRYLGVAEPDLTDAAQEVFVVVNRRYAEFEGRSALSTWIHAICLRVAMNHRKKHRRRREDVVSEPPEARIEPDQQLNLERREERTLLTSVLDLLDDRQREIIVLHEIERLPMREVAEIVGCPLQTAYTRRKTALEKMRDELVRRRKQNEKA